MPDYEVVVLTLRSGMHTVKVEADDALSARALVQSDCSDGKCHCPPEWCTDDVQSDVVEVRTAADEDVTYERDNRVGR